jgi:hypothetical protein
MDRYIGLDAHASSCTLAVVSGSGKRIATQVVETNARCLIEAVRQIPKPRHICLEEGTLSEWLYEVLSPHAEEVAVAAVRESRGPKDDRRDAFGLADQLRVGGVHRKVLQGARSLPSAGLSGPGAPVGDGGCGAREEPDQERVSLARSSGGGAGSLHGDEARRLPEAASARGAAAGGGVVRGTGRPGGPAASSEEGHAGRSEAARGVPAGEKLPGAGSGPLGRTASDRHDAVPVPEQAGFWAYCGLGIVQRSSSDWVRAASGEWTRAQVRQTRG